ETSLPISVRTFASMARNSGSSSTTKILKVIGTIPGLGLVLLHSKDQKQRVASSWREMPAPAAFSTGIVFRDRSAPSTESCYLFPRYLVALDLVIECLVVDSQAAGGLGLVPVAVQEHLDNQFSLDLFNCG